MATKQSNGLVELIQNNGRMFTIFVSAFIIVSGIAIIENSNNWWILPSGIVALFIIAFLYMNARVFIKIAVVILLNLFLATAAFQVGSFADETSTGGLVWLSSVLFNFFTTLSLSYLLTSAKGKWGPIGFSSVIGFLVTYIFGVGGINLSLSAVLGTLVAIVSFVIVYLVGNKNKYTNSSMPTNILTDELSNNIVEVFETNGWNATSLKDQDDDSGSVLVWENKAYVLYPVYLDESFTTVETKRTSMLAYQDESVNPWLLNLVFTKIPVWKARNAHINLVLLDVNNNNGKLPRVIGVNVPDSQKKIPVGIIPAKSLLSTDGKILDSVDYEPVGKMSNRQKQKLKKASSKINLNDPSDVITMIDAEMSLYTRDLKPRQAVALSRIGKTEEDVNKDSTKVKKPVLKRKGKKTKKNDDVSGENLEKDDDEN